MRKLLLSTAILLGLTLPSVADTSYSPLPSCQTSEATLNAARRNGDEVYVIKNPDDVATFLKRFYTSSNTEPKSGTEIAFIDVEGQVSFVIINGDDQVCGSYVTSEQEFGDWDQGLKTELLK